MTPDYKNAARKAAEIQNRYNTTDPANVLAKLRNVRLISYETDFPVFGSNDAFSLVNKSGDDLQYIIIYNRSLPPVRIRTALARELGHVMLEHDGKSPEEVWQEEATCFAYHFICPVQKEKINFRPPRFCLSWEMKDSLIFDSIEEMKGYIIEERNKINRFIGKAEILTADDVRLQKQKDHDSRTGWKNCYDIVLHGKTVGYCGE